MDTVTTGNKVFLSGFVAIVGPPNAGKSTILNRLLGSKVSIVTPKPQTTRNRILGIYNGDGFQMAFLDTPGIHRTRTPLHESMVSSAQKALFEVDVVILVIDMSRPHDPGISLILSNLKKIEKPVILVVNKIDTGPKKRVLPIIEAYSRQFPFDAIIPVSAIKGDGIEILLEELKANIKPGPEFFPKDMTTGQSETFLVSEIIREKIFLHTRRELPYSSAVTVVRMEEIPEKELLSISAIIHVESESQKAIMIGHGGRNIKKIGKSSRMELEKIFEIHVYLDLIARVEKNWTKNTTSLRKLGY